MTDATIYARFSPRPNADESESCEKQQAICEEYCRAKGYSVAWYFDDRKRSGDEEDRPGLWAAIDSLSKGSVLVVRWRHRLARNVYLSELIKRAVAKAGARIEEVEGCPNDDTPENEMIRQIFDAFAEYQKKVTAIRTRLGMQRNQRNGWRMGHQSKIPYGYRLDETGPVNNKGVALRIVKDEAEQKAIAKMRKMKSDGMSYYRISKELDSAGIRPRLSERWSLVTVKQILQRQAV
jgi:DNA invertase Pin-like site-specific DNA recombinase